MSEQQMSFSLSEQVDRVLSKKTPIAQQNQQEPVCIHVKYGGCDFRSRPEARWAVFFDNAGIEYQYEPDGFNLKTRPYLVDFFLPEMDIFVEVKSSAEKFYEGAKTKLAELMKATKKNAIVAFGNLRFQFCTVDSNGELVIFENKDSFLDQCADHPEHRWFGSLRRDGDLVCPKCGSKKANAALWGHFPLTLGQSSDTVFLRSAMMARSARFEYGETPNKQENEEKDMPF